MEFYLGNQVSNPYNSDTGSKVVYRYFFLIIYTYYISSFIQPHKTMLFLTMSVKLQKDQVWEILQKH